MWTALMQGEIIWFIGGKDQPNQRIDCETKQKRQLRLPMYKLRGREWTWGKLEAGLKYLLVLRSMKKTPEIL